MKRNSIIVAIIGVSLFSLGHTFAGIGDGAGPFNDRASESQNTSAFGSSSSFGNQEEEGIADVGDPPIDPGSLDDVPLDGGASLLLLGGAVAGLSRTLKRRRNVLRKQ